MIKKLLTITGLSALAAWIYSISNKPDTPVKEERKPQKKNYRRRRYVNPNASPYAKSTRPGKNADEKKDEPFKKQYRRRPRKNKQAQPKDGNSQQPRQEAPQQAAPSQN